MSWTKRQFVLQAFEELGIASYDFDLQPEQLQFALRRLDAMMASWDAKGIRLGYPLPSSPQDSDLDTATNVPDAANEAIFTNLALRIAPSIGKNVPQDTRVWAKDSYMTLIRRAVNHTEQQIGGIPYGAGNKPWRTRQYMPEPDETLDVDDDGELIVE